MSEIVAVVSIKAAAGRGDDVQAAFEAAIKETHAEEGCIKYALHRDNSDPDRFVHIEQWRSQADLDAHMQQPYMAALFAAAGEPGMLAEPPAMWFTSPLGIGDPDKGAL
jgi:quinol monooxygenase YgiN